MLRILALLGLLVSSSAALAQAIYKCSAGGRVTYASAPCDGASVTAIAVPVAPAPDPQAALLFKREKALLATLQHERASREAREQRAAAIAQQSAARHHQRCARIALQKRWADDNANRAAGPAKEPLKRRAKQMGEAMAIECPV